MKGIRRAAAVCLTMTLAVSTLFGNTAWADMPQKMEKKKCVHVHTEECYGEPDEEATSSQIGEEPTECTTFAVWKADAYGIQPCLPV